MGPVISYPALDARQCFFSISNFHVTLNNSGWRPASGWKNWNAIVLQGLLISGRCGRDRMMRYIQAAEVYGRNHCKKIERPRPQSFPFHNSLPVESKIVKDFEASQIYIWKSPNSPTPWVPLQALDEGTLRFAGEAFSTFKKKLLQFSDINDVCLPLQLLHNTTRSFLKLSRQISSHSVAASNLVQLIPL